ncbi:hypothetical protein FO519_003669 [Halicephalobus sp. NKZ332]|nr:hypothetical protein FO519_003669 [Halicephalobus sp. NKZ332]
MERIRRVLERTEARKKIGSVKKSLKGVSWFAVGTVFLFILGIIFFIVGIVNLTSVAFLGKCFCPRPPQRPPRTHVHRHRGRRVSAPNERSAPRPQRIWSTPPPLDASTPTYLEPRTPTSLGPRTPTSLEPRTPVSDVSMRPAPLGERRPSNAPPTYDEAIGRLRQSAVNPLDPNPPPYNPELESIQISLP